MRKKRQRRDFTYEFKNDAVKLVIEQGYNCSEVARRPGIDQSNVSRWVRSHRACFENKTASGSQQDLEVEVKRLRKENKRLLMEREILKKAAAFFANESKNEILDCITYYNSIRLHTTLGYLSPMEYEKEPYLKAA